MRGVGFGIVTMAAGSGPGAAGFVLGRSRRRHPVAVPRSWSIPRTSLLASRREQALADEAPAPPPPHPHARVWSTTLAHAPNSYVHPGVALTLRPPSEGGTGILAADDLAEGTVALCLPLEEVSMLDAASVLDAYDATSGGDVVLDVLKDMWYAGPADTGRRNSEEGKRLAVLAGVVAHLQLTRYKDVVAATAATATPFREGHALDESRRLGLFLDAMPLLPRRGDDGPHPFPTHFLYWTEEEIQALLGGTMGHTRAREVRAGTGLVVREFSASFLAEHGAFLAPAQVLDGILSAFSAVLSRSFGDAAGRDADGKGRMLVPLADMLNHDGEDPNVRWTWHVGEGDEDKIAAGKGDIVVTTLRDVQKGEELRKCYGWRPAWDVAGSYGFVPRLTAARWECAVVPLFPATLDLAPGAVATPREVAEGATKLDLLLESNYGPLVKAVIAAVDAASETRARARRIGEGGDDAAADGEARPAQLQRLEVVSLFHPPPAGAAAAAFPRRQPCAVVGTKIRAANADSAVGADDRHHRQAVEAALPAFRAAASAIRQLRDNHRAAGADGAASPVEASRMAAAAAGSDAGAPWDAPALALLRDGVRERRRTLTDEGAAAATWLVRQDAAAGSEDRHIREQRQLRAGVARDVRDSELLVLCALQKTVDGM